MRSVAAQGGRWLWVPEEETDDSREGQVWGPACMPGIWMAYVNQGKHWTRLCSVPRSEWPELSSVVSTCALINCVSVCCELSNRSHKVSTCHISPGSSRLHMWTEWERVLYHPNLSPVIQSFLRFVLDGADVNKLVAGESTVSRLACKEWLCKWLICDVSQFGSLCQNRNSQLCILRCLVLNIRHNAASVITSCCTNE